MTEPEARALVLVKGGRRDAVDRSEVLEPERPASEPVMTEMDRSAVFAAELRLTIVRRACGWRLRPPSILSAVALVLGKLAATAVRGDGERLGLLIEGLHRKMRDAAEAALAGQETP